MNTVKDIRTLKAMAKAGLIIFHEDTGKKVGTLFGPDSKAYYVDYNPGTPSTFEYKGKKYELEYFDGCFCPFVVEAANGFKIQGENCPTDDVPLFWNNDEGWVDFDSATSFKESERNSINLPVGTTTLKSL